MLLKVATQPGPKTAHYRSLRTQPDVLLGLFSDLFGPGGVSALLLKEPPHPGRGQADLLQELWGRHRQRVRVSCSGDSRRESKPPPAARAQVAQCSARCGC